jgi:sugar lactone lactonase YvrE
MHRTPVASRVRAAKLSLACVAVAGLIGTGCEMFGGSSESARKPDDRQAQRDAQLASASVGHPREARPTAENAPATKPSMRQTVRIGAADGQLGTVTAGPAKGKRAEQLQSMAMLSGPIVTGVTASRDGRVFVCYPRWGDPVNFTVAEIKGDQLIPFPDPAAHSFDPQNPSKYDPATHLVSVQSVVADAKDRLWLVDTGSIDMQPPVPGGPKLWGYDLRSGQRVSAIALGGNVIKPKTYLNDVRVDVSRGPQGTAYITDSGEGGIIVIDLASGEAWRKLDGHPSVLPESNFVPNVEGEPALRRPPGTREEKPIQVASDGIALSPDGRTLYYSPLSGRTVYLVPTDVLNDRNASDPTAGFDAVKKVASKPSGNDGLLCDDQGRIYTTDYEDNCIRRIDPQTGAVEVIAQDERLLWPDTLSLTSDGQLLITASQLNRQPGYHHGRDLRQQPYVIWKLPIDGRAITNR